MSDVMAAPVAQRRQSAAFLPLFVFGTFGAALALGAILVPFYQPAGSIQYLSGYAIEEALSIDNLFVFLLLFRLFRIPEARQPRVLFWGVLGAIILRGAFIAGGIGLLTHFHWISYVFGVVLLYAAVNMLKPDDPAKAQAKPLCSAAALPRFD